MKSAVSWNRQKGGGKEGGRWWAGAEGSVLCWPERPAEPPAAPGWREGSPTPTVSAGQACRLERVTLRGRGGMGPPPRTQRGRPIILGRRAHLASNVQVSTVRNEIPAAERGPRPGRLVPDELALQAAPGRASVLKWSPQPVGQGGECPLLLQAAQLGLGWKLASPKQAQTSVHHGTSQPPSPQPWLLSAQARPKWLLLRRHRPAAQVT